MGGEGIRSPCRARFTSAALRLDTSGTREHLTVPRTEESPLP